MTGTVFDIGYRRYTGIREGRQRSFTAVFKDGVRIALGLGRGGRAKILPWFFVVALSGLGLILALIAGAAERFGGAGAAERADLPSHNDYYAIASIIMFVFGALVAPELLCRDRREGTMQLYLVRPTSATDYVAGRFAAFLVVMTGAAWLPQVLLFLGLSAGSADPNAYVASHWMDIPRFLVSGLAMSAFVTSLAMLTASFTTRRAYAAIFLVGLIAITAPFTAGLSQELDGPVGQWISMFTITNIPVHVNDIIFREVSDLTEDARARDLSREVRVAWFFLWTIAPAALLWHRYRRLTA